MIDNLLNTYIEFKEDNITRLTKEFEEDLTAFFLDHQINLILEDFKRNTNNINIRVLTEEPSGLLQIALLTNAIYIRLCENSSSDRIAILKNAFRDSLANRVTQIIDKSKHQFIKLFVFLHQIADKCVNTKKSKICILELPLGNSIPSILLQKILTTKGLDTELITISINRNDTKQKGITRKELIKDKLKEVDLDNTILIYLDEWITGSNFNNIITILSKMTGLKFLPCPFLTSESTLKDKYSQYKSRHSKICTTMGYDSDELSIELPDLNFSIVSEQKFIWTESDRLAGYRKLEFLGSIVSTFFAVGELLLEDSKSLNEALKNAIAEYTSLPPETEIPSEMKEKIMNSFQYFNSTFVSDIEKKIKSIEIINSPVFNFESEMTKVISLFENTNGYNDAQLAINIIGYHIRNTIITPSSRYFYKGSVPLCLVLEGDEKYLNTLFIEKITERFIN